MRRAVLAVCDGLRHDLVTAATCPEIARHSANGRRFCAHAAVFPSVTRPSAAAIATGCHPGRHGLIGNAFALPEGGRLVIADTGKPEFRERWRRATGRTLKVPTLAERLAGHGGVQVFANGSAGAACLHDPDGFGEVHHRAGSFGPGREPLPPLEVAHGPAGDLATTERFCAEALAVGGPALAVLWLCEPDRTGHLAGIGAPEHLAAIASADRCVGLVIDAVRRLQAAGDDVLLLIGADHGQETIIETIDLDPLLVAAGLKDAPEADDVLVAAQGSAGLIHLSGAARGRCSAIAAWLAGQPWLGRLWAGEALHQVRLAPTGSLAIAFSLARSDAPNRFGVPGLTFELGRSSGELGRSSGGQDKAGLATHGGCGRYETHPTLLVAGGGFAPGTATAAPTSVTDLAPTILRHLGRPHHDLDGRPLAPA